MKKFLTLFLLFGVILISMTHVVQGQLNGNQPFNPPEPVLSATQAPGVWYPDRYQPAIFDSYYFNSDSVLRLGIDLNDGCQLRPGGYNSTFYNTQGRKYDLASDVSVMYGSLYIPADWATKHRRSDIWATAFDVSNAITSYPIIGFANTTGSNPTFRYWDDNLGWINATYTVTYDQWYDFKIVLSSLFVYYYINGTLVGTVSSYNSAYFGNMIVQGYNFNDNTLDPSFYDGSTDATYEIYWDNIGSYGGPITYAPKLIREASTTVIVPIKVRRFIDINAVSLRLTYDATKLTFVPPVPESSAMGPGVPAGSTYILAPTPGTVNISHTTSTGFNLADDAVLLNLTFNYTTGTAPLTWLDDASSIDLEYQNYSTQLPYIDIPTATYYIPGYVTNGTITFTREYPGYPPSQTNETVTAVVTGGTGTYTNYAWTGPGGFTGSGNPLTLPFGIYGDYTVVVTDSDGATIVGTYHYDRVHNINTFLDYHFMQAGVSAGTTADGHTLLVDGAGEIYDEQVIVSKELTIIGVYSPKPEVNFTGTMAGKATLFDVTRNNVTIENFNMKVDLVKLSSAIIASSADLDNITIKSNDIAAIGSSAAGNYDGYGNRNAVSVNYAGYRVATGGVDNIIFMNNTVSGVANDGFGVARYFRSGISVDEGSGSFTGNTLQTINHDILIRFANGGVVTVSGNNLNGGGMEFADFNAGAGVLNISSNIFNGAFANTYSNALRLRNNYAARTTSLSGNTFTGFDWSVTMENYQAITLDGNSFTPPAGSTTYRHITLNTKDGSSASGFYPPVVGAIYTNNTFNGSGTPGGMALGFYNWDNDSPVFNAITLGTAANENIFNSGIATFIYLDNSTGTAAPNATTMVPWAIDLNAVNNKFDVGTGLKLPAGMTLPDLFNLEDQITHKIDDGRTGFVLVYANNAYVTDIASPSAINNDYTRIRNAVNYVFDNWTINLHGTFDWTETNAAVSWALGNDDISGNDDDYTLLVPEGLEGVTFTAPIGLGDARITGPGDVPSVNLEGTLQFWLGNNRDWTISNMEIYDFDLAIGMFYVGTTDYNNTIITNNHIRVATDWNATVYPAENFQNIGIHYAFGTNQTISNNVIDIPGDGVSDGTNYSSSIGMQSNTSGGAVYEGLAITGNTINVLNAQSANPQVILGIWENGHAHNSNITVSGNQFLNLAGGNNPALNLQRGFRVTSHSSASTTVTYSGNTVVGANMGFQWIAGSDFSAQYPVMMTSNILTNNYTGVLVQSGGKATFTTNTVTGSNVAVDVAENSLVTLTANTIDANVLGVMFRTNGGLVSAVNNFITDNTSDGIQVAAGAGTIGAINNNDLSGNSTWAIDNLSGPIADATCNWFGMSDVAGVTAEVNGTVDFDPWLIDGDDSGDPGFVPDGPCAGAANLYVNDATSDANDIYTTAPGDDISGDGTASAPFLTIMKAVNTAVTGTKIWVDAGTFPEQVSVGKTVNITGVDRTKTIVKAPATMTSVAWNGAHPIVYAYGNSNTVNISKIAIDGDGGRSVNWFVGMLYYDANGTFDLNSITGIHDAGGFSGAQMGHAFYGTQAGSLTQTLAVTNNLVSDYQKGGIYIRTAGTTATVTGNTVTGQNVPMVNAQNGIVILVGAGATVTGNTVTNNIWNKVEHPHQYTASGILLYQSAASTVSGNILNGNEVAFATYLAAGPTPYGANTFNNNKIHVWLDATGDINPGDVYDKYVLNTLVLPEVVFGCIQYAIDEADPLAPPDILDASAGTFAENVIVHTPVSILGPKATVSGCDGSRGTGEAIVVPFTDDVYGEIFHVAASDVTIKGFTIDGDNPALPANGYGFSGADMHAAEGVTVYETGINNLNVTNNIFQNLLYFGVTLYDYPAGVPSTGHVISYNKFLNLGTYDPASTMDYWGGGVLLYNNQYTNVSHNCMENVRLGVQTGNYYQANPGAVTYQLIDYNTIEARRSGIFHNLHYSAASPFTLSNNEITALANANETKWDGITLSSLSVASTSTDNTIDGNGVVRTNLIKGYEIWNVAATTPANTITGGSVIDVDYGVFANNYEGYDSDGPDGAHATVTGVTITPRTTGIGVYIFDSPGSTTHAPVQLTLNGNSISGGLEGVKFEKTTTGVVGGTVSGNTISASAFGIDVTSCVTSVTNPLTIQNNDITMAQITGTPNVGISLANISGTAATISGNDIIGPFYGYAVYNLNTTTPTDISGGTISGVMQGVSAFNVNSSAVWAPSTFNVSGISMSGFAGNHPSIPAANFQAGVYAYTGGTSLANKITMIVNNVTVDGTGKIQQDCAGMSFADFSGIAGMQDITVTASTLLNNLNRGINIRAGVDAEIQTSTLTNNGGDAYGTGGNDGFGIISRVNSTVYVHNNYISNPATVAGSYPVTAMFADGGTFTAENNHITNAGTAYLLADAASATGTFTATCNWWGSANFDNISPLIGLYVDDYIPWLNSGLESDPAPGFQPDGTCDGNPIITGTFKYYHPTPASQAAMNGVVVDLVDALNAHIATATVASGVYTFDDSDINLGNYTIEIMSNPKTAGSWNSTDAAQVNSWGASNYWIQYVRFLAGDVYGGPNYFINAIDAQHIQLQFVYQGSPNQFDRGPWSYWKANTPVNDDVNLGPIALTVSGANLTGFNLFGISTGDFNSSFLWGSLKGVKSSVMLTYGDPLQADVNTEMELPLRIVNASTVSAASLILNFPSDLAEIMDVTMDQSAGQLDWAVNGDELRIGWNSSVPLSFASGDVLINIRLVTTGEFLQGKSIRFSLTADPMNELADGSFVTIPDAELSINTLESAALGTPDQSGIESLTLASYPNPFATYTTLKYTLPSDGQVTLEISNVLGMKVATVVNELQTSGTYSFKLDALPLQPGVYTATIKLVTAAGDMVKTIKLVRNR